MNLTTDQEKQIKDMKRFFPFRIVFGALHPETLDFQCHAVYSKSPQRRLAKAGYSIFVIK